MPCQLSSGILPERIRLCPMQVRLKRKPETVEQKDDEKLKKQATDVPA